VQRSGGELLALEFALRVLLDKSSALIVTNWQPGEYTIALKLLTGLPSTPVLTTIRSLSGLAMLEDCCTAGSPFRE
jgi:hypothetical protein